MDESHLELDCTRTIVLTDGDGKRFGAEPRKGDYLRASLSQLSWRFQALSHLGIITMEKQTTRSPSLKERIIRTATWDDMTTNTSIADALELLQNPKRLIATLRS